MSSSLAATLPAGHKLALAASSRTTKKSPSGSRRANMQPEATYERQHVVLIQSVLRRRHAREQRKTLEKCRARRTRILQEIKATETDYVKNLSVLVESFLARLGRSDEFADVLKPRLQQEFALVLPGVEMIRSYHVTLLAALMGIDMDNPYFEVGGIFLEVVMYFKSYSQFVSHYQVIVQILAQRKQEPELQQVFESLKPQALGKGLKDYMIMPVQRIPRYALLLHDMLRHTWAGHPDVAALTAAYNKVLDIAHNIENMSADAVSIAKVFELSACFLQNGEVFKLVVPHRRYIADAECLCSLPAKGVVMKNLQVFLFNDIIIWVKAKKDNKFSVIYTLPTLMLSNICMTDLWQETGGAEFIEMETLDSDRLRMIVLDKNEEWFQYLELTKKNGKAWLPHHTSRDVSTTARYLTVGGEAAKAARQSPKVKDTNKTKNKSLKLLGALRSKKSKVDVRDLGWKLSGKDRERDTSLGEMTFSDRSKDTKSVSTTETLRVTSLDLEQVTEKEKKSGNRPKSSRSTRDRLDSKSTGTFKRTLSDRASKEKMIFSSDKHWADDERGRAREREKSKLEKDKDKDKETGKERSGKDKEKEKDKADEREGSSKGKERSKSKDQSSREPHKRVKRRSSKQESAEQLSPRRGSSSGISHKSKDSSPKAREASEKKDRRERKGSESISTDDELDAVLLLDVKPTRHGRRHRKVASSDQSPTQERRSSSSSLSPSPKLDRKQGDDSSDREESSSSRTHKKRKQHRSRSKSKKAASRTMLEVPSEEAQDSPSVLRKSLSMTNVPSPRDSPPVATESKTQRRTRSRKTSSSSAMDGSEEEEEELALALAHALSTPAILSSANASAHSDEHGEEGSEDVREETFETAVNMKKLERARKARAVLRSAQRDSSSEMMPTPPVTRFAAVRRRNTDKSSKSNSLSVLDRASTATLQAPTPEGSAASISDAGVGEKVSASKDEIVSLSWKAEAGFPVPESLDDNDGGSESSAGSGTASPSVKKKGHRRVRSIGARVSPSISRTPGGHRRRRSGSNMSVDEEESQEASLAGSKRNESVRDLVEVFMSAQMALVSSPADKKALVADKKAFVAVKSPSATRMAESETAPPSAGSGDECGAEDSSIAKGRWRKKSGVERRKFSGSGVSAAAAALPSERGLAQSRTGEFGKPIRCTPADFARHDSLQEMSTVTSLLGQFQAMSSEEADSGKSSQRRPQRMNSEDPSALSKTVERGRSNSLESPRTTEEPDVGKSEHAEEQERESGRLRKRPARHVSHNSNLGRSITSSGLVGCEFTPVTTIFDSLAQQGVKDPKVLERLKEAAQRLDRREGSSSSGEESDESLQQTHRVGRVRPTEDSDDSDDTDDSYDESN